MNLIIVSLISKKKDGNFYEMKELLKDKNCYKRLTKDFDYLPVKNQKSIPVKPYFLPFRIVRFKLTDNTVETVLTNLDMEDFRLQN